jgi:Domain of unknown function (DUF4062)
MSETRKIVKVFLASPNDLVDERKTAKAVVDEFNNLLASEFGYQVELVGWEDTVSVLGRPQETINKELSQCELFVGMLWKRWGTPPDKDGVYTSGFEEEYRRSVDRHGQEGQPEISLFFKDVSSDNLRDPGPELNKVLAFKKELIDGKTILFEAFGDVGDFQGKFRRCITSYIIGLRNQERDVSAELRQTPTEGGANELPNDEGGDTRDTPLSREGAKFLRDFVAQTEDHEGARMSATEVARFRLLGTIVSLQGNDEQTLGVHDANLLFATREDLALGSREQNGLVSTGLSNYKGENVPLWWWLDKTDGIRRQILPIYSVIRSVPDRRIGAISAMRLIAEPIPASHDFERSDYIGAWLADDSPDNVRVAALEYLLDHGVTADVSAVRKEFDRNNYQTRTVAANAMIQIYARDSRKRAFEALLELQEASVDERILREIFSDDAEFSNAELLKAVGHPSSEIRAKAVGLLRKRQGLPPPVVEQLMGDNDPTVRYEALMTSMEGGREFSVEEAKKVLVKTVASGGLGLFSRPVKQGEAVQRRFHVQHLKSLNDEQLKNAMVADAPFDITASLVLTERHFKRLGDQLRTAIDNQYQKEFDGLMRDLSERIGVGDGDETIAKIRSLESMLRQQFTREALDLICHMQEREDLQRIRSAIKQGTALYSPAYMAYMEKHGEWDDIPLIVELLEAPHRGGNFSLLDLPDNTTYKNVARVVYSLGHSRLGELLSMQLPSQLLPKIVASIPDSEFRLLNDSTVMMLLLSKQNDTRKISALKCVKALPKKRVADLLANYLAIGDQRYYNVIHWLDMGASLPRIRAVGAARRKLRDD